MFFTQDDYKKIQQWLIKNSVKDTEFNEANIPFNGEETITIVQGNQNKKVFLKDLIAQVFNLGISDFVNITDKYDAPNISLEEAIRLIPSRARKEGQVITFLDREDHWHIYQFKGVLNQWNVLDTWEDLFDWEKLIIDSILPDEEDLTKSPADENGNSYLSLKDREYNPEDFSGLGRIILRKNIVEVEDPIYGKVKKNYLYQDMINKENTIYEIRYDFDLNGEEITIPEGCVLDFQGGSLSNGTIDFNFTTINSTDIQIFDNITWENLSKLNIKWFGAKGDNLTDDTKIFQEVLSHPYITVYFPQGVYVLSDTINPLMSDGKNEKVNQQTWIGSTSIKKSTYNDDDAIYESTTVFKLIGNLNGVTDAVFCYAPHCMKNINIIGEKQILEHSPWSTTLYDNVIGILLSDDYFNTNEAYFENINVYYFNKGIVIKACFSNELTNITVRGCNYGMYINPIQVAGVDSGYITRILVRNTNLTGSKYNGLYIRGGYHHLWFDYCCIEGNGWGDRITYADVYTSSYVGDHYFTNFYAESNTENHAIFEMVSTGAYYKFVLSNSVLVPIAGTYAKVLFKGGGYYNIENVKASRVTVETSSPSTSLRIYDSEIYDVVHPKNNLTTGRTRSLSIYNTIRTKNNSESVSLEGISMGNIESIHKETDDFNGYTFGFYNIWDKNYSYKRVVYKDGFDNRIKTLDGYPYLKNYGETLPSLDNLTNQDVGYKFFNTKYNLYHVWNGKEFVSPIDGYMQEASIKKKVVMIKFKKSITPMVEERLLYDTSFIAYLAPDYNGDRYTFTHKIEKYYINIPQSIYVDEPYRGIAPTVQIQKGYDVIYLKNVHSYSYSILEDARKEIAIVLEFNTEINEFLSLFVHSKMEVSEILQFDDISEIDDSVYFYSNTTEVTQEDVENRAILIGNSFIKEESPKKNIKAGAKYFNSISNMPYWYNGTKWVNAFGENENIKYSGTTSERPSNIRIGFQYFDTTLAKPIWWSGTKWVDTTGADV